MISRANSLATTALAVFLSLPVVLAAQQAPPTLVSTEEVRLMDFHQQVVLVGRTEAWVESRIVSEVSGRVQSIEASEGAYVRAGSPLVRIDSDRTHFLFEAKKAETREAQLQAELANANLDRAKELHKQNLVRQTTLDSALAWVGIAAERHNRLVAEQAQLQLDLDNSVISAPFSGYSGRKLVDIGEWVNPGMPVFEMVELSRVKVQVDLPERYFGRLSAGSPVVVTGSGQTDIHLTGSVTGIAPNASRETHTFPVLIEVPNSEGLLGGGMLVRVTLSLDQQFSSLAVSKDAIVRQGNQTMVYTVADGKAQPVPVITSSTDGVWIAVEGQGLSAGMPVVTRGNERIFPGSPIRVAENPTMEVGSVGEPSSESSN